jgi:GNAT superfamily N-acetyltransferase
MEGVPVIEAECSSTSLNVTAILNGVEIGHFTLAGEQGRDIIKFNGGENKCEGAKWIKLAGRGYTPATYGGTIDTTIFIEEEYRGKGLSTRMVMKMLQTLESLGCPNEQTFHIDVDASDGYWDKLGYDVWPQHMDHPRAMRRAEMSELPGSGYEKGITFLELKRNMRFGQRRFDFEEITEERGRKRSPSPVRSRNRRKSRGRSKTRKQSPTRSRRRSKSASKTRSRSRSRYRRKTRSRSV